MAVIVSLKKKSKFVILLNPTPHGLSMNNKFAFKFHEYSFNWNLFSKGKDMTGPSSPKNPNNDEHPGPPFNQRNKGSFDGDDWLGVKT